MNKIESKVHRIGTYEIDKISLSCFNDKIHILNTGYDRLALCYQNSLQRTVILTVNSYLFKTAFLSSYENFFLTFSLVRAAFLPSYKNII